MRARVQRAHRFCGEATVPGDKSIAHRALILAAIATGTTRIEGLPHGADVRSTITCLRALGVRIEESGTDAVVQGVGLRGLRRSAEPLPCGNSGTTMRLLAGLLAGSGTGGTLDGDESLRRRPMERVLAPLRAMGARCTSTGGSAPLHIEPGHLLRGVDHTLPVASAQVKSALLLAGLYADGPTTVREPLRSRDHTERMLTAFGAPVYTAPTAAPCPASQPPGTTVPTAAAQPPGGTTPAAAPQQLGPDTPTVPALVIHPVDALHAPTILRIPGDPSSAAFLAAGALLIPGGSVTLRHVGANPTRTGFLAVLERMGAALTRTPRPPAAGDPVEDLTVHHRPLRATTIEPHEIPALVDEVPLLAVLAATAHGTTVIRGAAELRLKESDRLQATAAGLHAMGADIEELPDGLRIHGPTALRGAHIATHGDHRLAMAFALAGLAADGTTTLDDAGCAAISFPSFYETLQALGGALQVA